MKDLISKKDFVTFNIDRLEMVLANIKWEEVELQNLKDFISEEKQASQDKKELVHIITDVFTKQNKKEITLWVTIPFHNHSISIPAWVVQWIYWINVYTEKMFVEKYGEKEGKETWARYIAREGTSTDRCDNAIWVSIVAGKNFTNDNWKKGNYKIQRYHPGPGILTMGVK